MNSFTTLTGLFLSVFAATHSFANSDPATKNKDFSEFTVAWTLKEGLDTPESVVYDETRKQLYVSNVQGNPPEKDGKGYIAIVSLEGKLIKSQWVSGLNAPKGMAVVKDTLYVTDIDKLIEIDIKEGKVINQYPAKDAQFLNDISADKLGNVYVSDMFTDTIWCLCQSKFDVWLHASELESPNGLFAEETRLVVGTWGVRTDGFNTSSAGHLKAVDYTSKKVETLSGEKPVGHLDGVMSDGAKGYLATDWMAGKLFQVDVAQTVHELMSLGQGSADATYLVEQKLLLVPMMMQNQVKAFKKQ